MQKRRRGSLIVVILLFCLITLAQSAPVNISVGVILDSNSSLVNTTLDIALEDFYDTHRSYTTKLKLLFNTAENDLGAASAACDQIYKQNVSAILGPQNPEQARHVVEHGNVANVPVIWFSPSGPSLLPPRTRFFIHSKSTRSHCSQFEAIAAIIKAYNWQSVFPIYEDPEFGYDLIPCLSFALQDMDTRVPYKSAIRQIFTDEKITEELYRIKNKRAHVFVAHMTVELWSRLVEPAQSAGMMSKGYAWILTQGLSSVLDPEALNVTAKGYMDYALGVKPTLNDSNKNNRISLSKTLMSKYGKTLSLYELWAYDTITALANAVENAGLVSYDVANRTSIRTSILKTNFSGLSGNFNLRQEQLEPPEFVVYNVKGQTEIIVGYWRPERGFEQNGSVVWPGNEEERPPKLKIGVPTKVNFIEFAKISREGQSASGFAVEVFRNVVAALPFPLFYEFVAVDNTEGYYGLLCSITDKNVDVIIGDITIVEDRTKCVDFTMPYLDSSVSMVVKVRPDCKNRWILLEPFDWKLWLILGVVFVGATVIVIILEGKMRDDTESKFKLFVCNPFLVYMSDVGSLRSDKSKWVVIVIMFVLSIAMQVYTANLTANLSERITTKPSSSKDLKEIKRNHKPVGYQNNSWVKEFLIHEIGLQKGQLKPLENLTEYEKALSNEDKNVTVDAIFDETPYLTLLLSKCSSCKMTGPIYKAGGFAFAFPRNSLLVSKFSAAILEVTQNVTVFHDMKNNIGLPITVNKSEYRSDVEMRSLTNDDFGGLFPIVYSVLALFFIISILKIPSVVAMLKKVPPIAFLLENVSSIAVWSHNKFVSFLSPSGGVIIIKSSN